jgi:hypothetical protein
VTRKEALLRLADAWDDDTTATPGQYACTAELRALLAGSAPPKVDP